MGGGDYADCHSLYKGILADYVKTVNKINLSAIIIPYCVTNQNLVRITKCVIRAIHT